MQKIMMKIILLQKLLEIKSRIKSSSIVDNNIYFKLIIFSNNP